MGFYDIYSRCMISATCRQWKAHDLKVANNPVYEDQKKNKPELQRFYFKGKVTYCQRSGCKYEVYEGDRVPYRKTVIVNGEETEVNSEAT